MNRKQVLVLSLSALISFGGLVNGGAAFAAQPNDLNMKIEECEEVVWENLSFEDFMKDMPTKDISKDDMKKLKKLYMESVQLEKDDSWDEASEKWDAFYELLDKYLDTDFVIEPFEFPSFEEFMKDMPTKDIPKNDMKKLKSLYKESVQLEEDSKWDDASEKWDEFYELLDKYLDTDFVIEPFEFPSFEELMKDMPTKDIPKDDMKKLKNLYEECTELEKDNKWDDADEKWDEFYELLDKYFDEDDKFEPIDEPVDFPTFEEFIKDMPEDISKGDMKKLESLYDECVELEKDDELDKAYDQWEEFYKILDKYFDEDDMYKAE